MAEFNSSVITWDLSRTDNKNQELEDCKTHDFAEKTLSSITAGFLVYQKKAITRKLPSIFLVIGNSDTVATNVYGTMLLSVLTLKPTSLPRLDQLCVHIYYHSKSALCSSMHYTGPCTVLPASMYHVLQHSNLKVCNSCFLIFIQCRLWAVRYVALTAIFDYYFLKGFEKLCSWVDSSVFLPVSSSVHTPPCPWPRTMFQPSWGHHFHPSDSGAGLVSSSPQPCPAEQGPPTALHSQRAA